MVKDCVCGSEALQELLELPYELCVHSLHEAAEARVPQKGLLSLQLLVDKLLERDTVHRVLQGQLQNKRHVFFLLLFNLSVREVQPLYLTPIEFGGTVLKCCLQQSQ